MLDCAITPNRANPMRISASSDKNKLIFVSCTPGILTDKSEKFYLFLSRLFIFLFSGVGGFNAI